MSYIKLLLVTSTFLILTTLSGCEKDGPAERAGESIDEKFEQAGDALEDTADKIEEKTNRNQQ